MHPFRSVLLSMLPWLHKNVTALLFFFALLGGAFVFPSFLEKHLENSWDLESWRTRFVQKVQETTEVQFGVEGVYYEFLTGVHLKGVFAQDKARTYRFYAEDVIIDIPLFSSLSKAKNPLEVKAIHVGAPRLQLNFSNNKNFQLLKESFSQVFSCLQKGRPNLNIPVFFHKMRVVPFKTYKNSFLNEMAVDLTLFPRRNSASDFPQTRIEISLTSFLKDKKESVTRGKNHDWKLYLERETTGNFRFEAKKVPVRMLVSLSDYYNLKDIRSFLKKEYVTFESGFVSGGGIFSVTEENKEKLSLSLSYHNVTAQLRVDLVPAFQLHNSEGNIALNLSIQQREQEMMTDIEFELNQKDVSVRFKKQTFPLTQIGSKNNKQIMYSLEGDIFALSEADAIKKNGLSINASQIIGHAKFTMNFLQKDKQLSFYGDASLENVEFPAVSLLLGKGKNKKPFKKHFRKRQLVFKKITWRKQKSQKDFSISFVADCVGSTIVLNGKGDITIMPSAEDFQIKTNLGFKMAWNKVTVPSFLRVLQSSHQHIQEEGRNIEIGNHINEMQKNKFYQGKLYRTFLAGLKLNGKLYLKDIQALPPIPSDLQFDIISDARRFRLSLSEFTQDKKVFTSHFVYTLYFLHNRLPRNNIDFKLSMHENENPLPLITGDDTPIRELDISYRYDGYGFSFANILRRSHSNLRIHANSLNLADKEIVEAISHSSFWKSKNIPVEKLFIQKSTSGIQVTLNFSGYSPLFRFSGVGNYNIGLGGDVRYTVQTKDLKKATAINRNQSKKMRILSSGRWVPDV